MNLYTSAFIFLITTSALIAQSLTGYVRDESGSGIAAATVALHALQRSTITDNNGKFSFDNLPKGYFTLEINHIGYKEETRNIDIHSSQNDLEIILKSTPLEMPVITVTAEAQPTAIKDATLSTSVLENEQLHRERKQSLGETIESLPGVSAFSGSPLSMKPVIRGLSGQRALVLSNGIRIESQTWDEPQSPEIDVLDLERIEVVRGAVSVLYGSDALGGVVNAVRANLPSIENGSSTLEGMFLLNAFSNNNQGSGSLSFNGASGKFGYRANFTSRIAGDYSSPAGTTANGSHVDAGKVFNSGATEINGSLIAGIRESWGTVVFDGIHFGQTYYIAPEPGRKEYELNINTGLYDSLPAAPRQEILHEKFGLTSYIPVSFGRFELQAVYQRNSRREEGVSETDADEKKKESLGIKPEAQLILNTISFDAKMHHNLIGPMFGTIGFSSANQSNTTEGQKAIIPAYTSINIAGYVYENIQAFDALRFSCGVRYDSRSLNIDANTQSGNPSTSLSFHALTGTAGAALQIIDELTLALNIGRGWRAPVAAELFFSGADEGTVRYKIGDESLQPEASRSLDASLRYRSSFLNAELSLFNNRINRYIYLAPTGQNIGGLSVYRYTQADATLSGGEFSLQATPASWIAVGVGTDIVRGTNDETDLPLPFIPANRIKANIRLLKNEISGIQQCYLDIRSRFVLKQNRPGDFETESPAYRLHDLSIGGVATIAGYEVTMDMSCENILNAAYYDHLSRYKEYALNPGRNFVLRIGVPFQIIK